MAEGLKFSTLWDDAVAEYEKQTNHKIEKDQVFRNFKTMDDLEDAIKEREKSFLAFRNEHRRAYSALRTSVMPLQQVLGLAQKGIGNTPYAPAAVALGAASYLLEACESVSKNYDAVEGLFQQIGDITIRFQVYDHSDMNPSLAKIVVDTLGLFLDIMGKAEATIKRKRLKEWVRSVFMKEENISSAVARLKDHVESESRLVIALTHSNVNRVLDNQKVTKASNDEILANQRGEQQRTLDEADEKKIAEALGTATFDEIAREQAGNKDRLTKGTAVWIRDDAMFQAWEQEQAPFLWVFGKPGVGKTMLAARTIKTLHDKYPQHSDFPSLTSISYLYFKHDNPKLQDCAQMWKTAALQITKTNDRFKKHVLTTIAAWKNRQDNLYSAQNVWQELFIEFFSESETAKSSTSLAYIVVDGLDEAPRLEREKFLICLSELLNRGPEQRRCRIQIAVFARPDIRADQGFEKVSFGMKQRLIEITPERSTADINLYIKQQLGNVSILQHLRKSNATQDYQSLARRIYNSVQVKSQGMFLWARLVFDQICSSSSPEIIDTVLDGAPEGLDEMLYSVFKRLEANEATHRSYLKNILTWVFCAERPLFVSELFVILIITAGQHPYMLEDDLRGKYSSLFDVTGPYGIADEKDPSDLNPDLSAEGDGSTDQDSFDFLDDEDPSYGSIIEDTDAASDDDNEGIRLSHGAAAIIKNKDLHTFEIPPRWHRTTVTFSHARIRDYLAKEGDPETRRWHDNSMVPALNSVRPSVFLACVQVLFSENTEKYEDDILKQYAKEYWIKHLIDIDFSKLARPVAVEVARNLSASFIDGLGLLKTSYGAEENFTKTWFRTSKSSSTVRKIIGDFAEDLDGGQREWALSAAKSTGSLFQPMVEACAFKWLTKTGWDDKAYLDKTQPEVLMLLECSSLTDEEFDYSGLTDLEIWLDLDTLKDRTVILGAMYGVSWLDVDTLESLSTMVAVPESAHYFVGLARSMMEANQEPHTRRAIQHFEKALELLPGGWVAKEGLARCYGENLKQYKIATRWMEDAIQDLPQTDDFQGIDLDLKTSMSDWVFHLGDNEESMKIARDAFEGSKALIFGTDSASDSRLLRVVVQYFQALYRTTRYDATLELIHDLDSRKTYQPETSLLTAFIQNYEDTSSSNDFFEKIGVIAHALANEKAYRFLDSVLVKAVNLTNANVREDSPIWLALQVGKWQYQYAKDQRESVTMLENIVTLVDQGDETVQQDQSWYRSAAARFLSLIYFDLAKEKRGSGDDASQIIAKLSRLAQSRRASENHYRASDSALILGFWLREYDGAEQDEWRACVRPSVKQALYLLSDDDPLNDQVAYYQLGQALWAAGDILNGKIAYGVTVRPLEDRRRKLAKEGESQDPSSIDNDERTSAVDLDVDEQQTKTEGSTGKKTSINTDKEEKSQTQNEDSLKSGKNDNNDDDNTALSTGQIDKGRHIAEQDRGKNEESKDHVNEDEEAKGRVSEDEKENDDESIEHEDANPKYQGFLDYFWFCDGPCDTPKSDYAELWFCRVCGQSCFCEKCIDLHRRDEIRIRNCASDHPLVCVYPMVPEAIELTDALIERRFDKQQKWLEQIRKAWDV